MTIGMVGKPQRRSIDPEARCPAGAFHLWGNAQTLYTFLAILLAMDMDGTAEKLENRIRRVKSSDSISQANRRYMLRFIDDCAAKGLSDKRQLKLLYVLETVDSYLGVDFDKATRDDIKKAVIRINKDKRPVKYPKGKRFKPYSEATKKDMRSGIKQFYKWLKGEDEYYPPEVRWIKAKTGNGRRLMPEELLTEEEVIKMVDAAEHPRDRAFIHVLFESGCRISEVLGVRLKHVTFDEYGAQVVVDGKTGMRVIRLVSSIPVLTSWVNMHPFKDDPESFLWLQIGSKGRNQPVQYKAISKMLKKYGMKAGIKKRIYPHLFRHTRTTDLLKKGLNDAIVKKMQGWTPSSKVIAVYSHLSGQDVDDAVLSMYGKKKGEDHKLSKLTPRKCVRCGREHDITAKICNCGFPLDTEAAMLLDLKNKGLNQLAMMAMEQRTGDLKDRDTDMVEVITSMVCERMRKRGLLISHSG